MKSSLKTLMFAAAAGAFLTAGTASAERPATLGNTTWTMQTNQEAVQLIIISQSGTGAPGAATCQVIHGELGIAPPTVHIRGWYCPSTGRIHFVHKNADSANAVRVFTGNVSDEVPGQTLSMGGTMTVLESVFGDYGEYSFSATQSQ